MSVSRIGNPRIKYGENYIDFDKPVSGFKNYALYRRATIEMKSGQTAHLSRASREKVEALLDNTIAQKIIDEIRHFYEYCKDGTSFEFWRDRKLGGYWSFDGTLKNSDLVGPTIGTDFTRSNSGGLTNASYIEHGTGLVKLLETEHEPRFTEGRFGDRALLIGSQRENIIGHSVDHGNAAWAKSGGVSVENNTSDLKDPTGEGGLADKLTTVGSGNLRYDTGVQIDTDDGCFSTMLKARQFQFTATLNIREATSLTLLESANFIVTTAWNKYYIAHDNPSTNSEDWMAEISLPAGIECYVFGSQFETDLYPTDWIPTVAAAATRNAESFEQTNADNIIEDNQGTVIMSFKPRWTIAEHSLRRDMFYSYGTHRHLTIYVQTDGDIEVRMDKANSTDPGVIGTFDASDLLFENTWHEIAVTWDCNIANGIKLYIDGALVGQSSNQRFVPCESTDFLLGKSLTANNGCDFEVGELYIYKEVLTAGEIKRVYNRRSALALERNYFPALELMIPNFQPEIIRGTSLYRYLLEALTVVT